MKYLGIDSNYLCWRGFHAIGNMAYNGQGTGVIQNFLTTLLFHAKHFGLSKPIFAFDSRKNIRKKILPGYKDRSSSIADDDRKQVGEQITLLRKEILPSIGFKNIFMQTGMEADDILARLVRDNPNKFIIVTADEDMLQLVDQCIWYSPATKRTMNERTFREKYGIAPRDWRMVKAIGGCSSDKVPGVPGVGEKTALKYLTGSLKKETIAHMVIEDSKKEIRLYGRVVNLPHPRTEPVVIQEDSFNSSGLLAICDLYGLDRIAEKVGEWELTFR